MTKSYFTFIRFHTSGKIPDFCEPKKQHRKHYKISILLKFQMCVVLNSVLIISITFFYLLQFKYITKRILLSSANSLENCVRMITILFIICIWIIYYSNRQHISEMTTAKRRIQNWILTNWKIFALIYVNFKLNNKYIFVSNTQNYKNTKISS